MLVGGRRYRFERDALTAVDADNAAAKLESLSAVPAGLGGGFVFTTADAIYFGDTFDGPLRRVGTVPLGDSASFTVGPHIILSNPDGLISTRDARPSVKGPSGHLGQIAFSRRA